MDRREIRPVVLARIPRLSSSRGKASPEEAPVSTGRIISQAFSFKVLAGVALLLVAVAIVPLTFDQDAPTVEPTTTAETWSPGVPSASAEATVAWPAPVAEAPRNLSPMPGVACEASVADVTPASASIDEPLMSTWPNPSEPTAPQSAAGEEDPRADVNQSMALRPSEQIRSSYDSTRPSVR